MTEYKRGVLGLEKRENLRILAHPRSIRVVIDGYSVTMGDDTTRREYRAPYLEAQVRGEDREGVVETRVFRHFL